MRIGAYNVLGLTGYPKEESSVSIGEPGDQRNSEHFAAVFSGLGCDVLALLEGVAVRTDAGDRRSDATGTSLRDGRKVGYAISATRSGVAGIVGPWAYTRQQSRSPHGREGAI